MNDKGHYHSYDMGADPSEDLPLTRSPATVLQVERIGERWLSALLAPDPDAARRVIEFFTAHIRNPHTRKAYVRAAAGFAAWSERHGIAHLREAESVHVAAYVEELPRKPANLNDAEHAPVVRAAVRW